MATPASSCAEVDTGYLGQELELSTKSPRFFSAETYLSRGFRGTRTDVVTIFDAEDAPADRRDRDPRQAHARQCRRARTRSCSTASASWSPTTSRPRRRSRSSTSSSRKFVVEIELAGCALVYPLGPRSFATLCGDGSLLEVRLDDAGREKSRTVAPEVLRRRSGSADREGGACRRSLAVRLVRGRRVHRRYLRPGARVRREVVAVERRRARGEAGSPAGCSRTRCTRPTADSTRSCTRAARARTRIPVKPSGSTTWRRGNACRRSRSRNSRRRSPSARTLHRSSTRVSRRTRARGVRRAHGREAARDRERGESGRGSCSRSRGRRNESLRRTHAGRGAPRWLRAPRGARCSACFGRLLVGGAALPLLPVSRMASRGGRHVRRRRHQGPGELRLLALLRDRRLPVLVLRRQREHLSAGHVSVADDLGRHVPATPTTARAYIVSYNDCCGQRAADAACAIATRATARRTCPGSATTSIGVSAATTRSPTTARRRCSSASRTSERRRGRARGDALSRASDSCARRAIRHASLARNQLHAALPGLSPPRRKRCSGSGSRPARTRFGVPRLGRGARVPGARAGRGECADLGRRPRRASRSGPCGVSIPGTCPRTSRPTPRAKSRACATGNSRR